MENFLLEVVNKFGYWGILLLIFIENIFPPIPSEAVLLFGGALTVKTKMTPVGVIVAATIGAVAGAIVLYLVGRFFKEKRLKTIMEGRVGRMLHLNSEDVDKALSWFNKYQSRAVFICRCIPIVRSLISIPAGIAEMRMPRFLVLTTVGSLVWNTVLVSLGVLLGEAWEKVVPYFDKYTYLVIAVAGTAYLLYLLWGKIKQRKIRTK